LWKRSKKNGKEMKVSQLIIIFTNIEFEIILIYLRNVIWHLNKYIFYDDLASLWKGSFQRVKIMVKEAISWNLYDHWILFSYHKIQETNENVLVFQLHHVGQSSLVVWSRAKPMLNFVNCNPLQYDIPFEHLTHNYDQ